MNRRQLMGGAVAAAALPFATARAHAASASASAVASTATTVAGTHPREIRPELAWRVLEHGLGTGEHLRNCIAALVIDHRQKRALVRDVARRCPDDFLPYLRGLVREWRR